MAIKPNQQIQTQQAKPLASLKALMNSDTIKARFESSLKERAGAFMDSVLTVYRNSDALQKCNPDSIVSAALTAAALNLQLTPTLGYAAIVPYGDNAQFQMMTNGWIQLALRTNQYKKIYATEIYKDELKCYNSITNDIEFTPEDAHKMRQDKKDSDVIGFYCYFRLLSGYESQVYMSYAEVMAHAKKFSKSYQYDMSAKKATSGWSKFPIQMGIKTVIIKNLKRYGVMSAEMIQAVESEPDQTTTFEEAQVVANAESVRLSGSEVVDIEPKTADINPDNEPEWLTQQWG